jgi:peptidoglycan/xylan/chitin deacetylase (PgdA/CDA1 family)
MRLHLKSWLKSTLLFITLIPTTAPATTPIKNNETSHAVIFMYSHIGASKYPNTNISIKQFSAHLDYLDKNKYQVWPLGKIVDHLKNGLAIADRTVAITFDDGHLSVVKHAYPRLKKRGWPFTVFIYTDAMDHHPKRYITWEQMRDMRQHGASFANQSKTHDHLTRRRKKETTAAWTARVRADIEHAQQRIGDELGHNPEGTPMLFSYPYGEYNLALATLVEELGYVGIGEQSGPAGEYADLRVLPRYPMSEGHDSLDEFAAKASSLPLPVTEVQPWEPLLKKLNPPRMVATLAKSDARLDQLACQASGQGRIKVKWLDKKARRFAVQAPQPLRIGRSRYNCSAPSATQPERQYWFSHLWIVNAEGVVTEKLKALP